MSLKSKYILIFLLIFSSLSYGKKQRGEYATKNLLGQEYYLKRCSSCHGEGNKGGNMASIREWKELFSNKASELIYLHEEDNESKILIKYLNNKDFLNEKKDILQFLQEFAYDSENVPTCN